MKLLLGPGHHVQQPPLVAAGRRLLPAGPVVLRPQRDARLLGQQLECLAELQPFGLHHEAEHVAADVADPALPRLPLRIDVEARPAVVVPGADADEVAALATQLDVAAHQVDDVDRLADLFLGVVGRAEAHGECVLR